MDLTRKAIGVLQSLTASQRPPWGAPIRRDSHGIQVRRQYWNSAEPSSRGAPRSSCRWRSDKIGAKQKCAKPGSQAWRLRYGEIDRNGSPFSRLTQVTSMCTRIICVHIHR